MRKGRTEIDSPHFRFLVALTLVPLFLIAIALAEQDSQPLAGSYQPTVANDWWGHWRRGETLLNLERTQEAKKSMELGKKLAHQAFRKDRSGQQFLAYVANFEGNQYVSQGDALSVLDGKEKMDNYQKARKKYQEAIGLQQQAAYYVNRSIAIRRYVRTYFVLNKTRKKRSDLEKAIASLDTARDSGQRALRMDPELEAAQLELELTDLDSEYYHSMLGLPVDFPATPASTPAPRTLEEALQKIRELEKKVAELEERLGK